MSRRFCDENDLPTVELRMMYVAVAYKEDVMKTLRKSADHPLFTGVAIIALAAVINSPRIVEDPEQAIPNPIKVLPQATHDPAPLHQPPTTRYVFLPAGEPARSSVAQRWASGETESHGIANRSADRHRWGHRLTVSP